MKRTLSFMRSPQLPTTRAASSLRGGCGVMSSFHGHPFAMNRIRLLLKFRCVWTAPAAGSPTSLSLHVTISTCPARWLQFIVRRGPVLSLPSIVLIMGVTFTPSVKYVALLCALLLLPKGNGNCSFVLMVALPPPFPVLSSSLSKLVQKSVLLNSSCLCHSMLVLVLSLSSCGCSLSLSLIKWFLWSAVFRLN